MLKARYSALEHEAHPDDLYANTALKLTIEQANCATLERSILP